MPLAPAIALSFLVCIGAWIASHLPGRPKGA
jgi:hypothetical protein